MNSSRGWELRIDPGVLKTLQRISRRESERILEVIRLLPNDPYFGDLQKMKGYEDVWRRRVGTYRVFYRVMTGTKGILVFRVERRTSKTYS